MRPKGGVCVVLLVLLFVSGRSLAQEPGAQQLDNASERGEINWKNWIFQYAIGNGNQEGLVITDVEYKGKAVLRKASMPVVRVKYKGVQTPNGKDCGPFADAFYNNSYNVWIKPLSRSTIEPFPGKPGASDVVTFERVSGDGTSLLGIFVYAEIGGYKLWHGWIFTDTGRIEPILYSSGWSCEDGVIKNDHRHHPYWRFEFAVNGARNEIWELRAPAPGAKVASRKITYEENITRRNEQLSFAIFAPSFPQQHVLVQYQQAENDQIDPPDKPWYGFSKIDAGVRLQKAEEDRGWEFGPRGELGYMDVPEPVDRRDNVLWITCHLGHTYIVGKDDENNLSWHGTGPIIQLINW